VPAVHVVPHTHWDREWYLPYAVYRRRLVGLIDSLLRLLEDEPDLRFHLDGQLAVVDDYLELRPERAADLRRAAETGRVSLGPWYTLPDEHLVSGESLLRNLELGLRRAREFAPAADPMRVGYVPDQFGHTAQLPQLLRRAGIDTAVLWRGVPSSVCSSTFRWAALDGSEVEAVHMRHGYGHGKELPVEPGALADRLEGEVERQREFNPKGPWLVMTGDDHLPVPVGLPAALAHAAAAEAAAVTSLAEYVAARPRPPEGEAVRGELHSSASSFVLKGTLSARFPLKLRHAAVERHLERVVEPLLALAGAPWPAAELGYAWRQLILNAAHDSICGCSIDQVHEEGSRRLDRAGRAAEAALDRLGPRTAWFNPVPRPRRGLPALGIGEVEAVAPEHVAAASLGLRLEDTPDRGDEYTHQPAGPPEVREATGIEAVGYPDEGFVRLRVAIRNDRPDHQLRLLVPATTGAGAWAGTAFGAVERAYREPGTEAGAEYDVATAPARGWVLAGGVAVLVPGPFEYELVPGAIAVTLLRCVGRLSRDDLDRRPGHAGPGVSTPAAQMLGEHEFELAIASGLESWPDAVAAHELFTLPPVPAPTAKLQPFDLLPAGEWLSALRREDGRLRLRTWSSVDFRIRDRWLDG